VAEFVDGYRAGSSVRELTRQFGIHKETVARHLERAGVSRRTTRRKLSNQDVVLAARLYQRGLSLQAVGERLGADGKTIMKELHRAGVPMRPRQGGRQRNR
jgi:IS30 family transposase